MWVRLWVTDIPPVPSARPALSCFVGAQGGLRHGLLFWSSRSSRGNGHKNRLRYWSSQPASPAGSPCAGLPAHRNQCVTFRSTLAPCSRSFRAVGRWAKPCGLPSAPSQRRSDGVAAPAGFSPPTQTGVCFTVRLVCRCCFSFAFLCFLLVVLLFEMAPKLSAEVPSSLPKTKRM